MREGEQFIRLPRAVPRSRLANAAVQSTERNEVPRGGHGGHIEGTAEHASIL